MSGKSANARAPRIRIIGAAIILLLAPGTALAQQPPWKRAASNLVLTFTEPLARALALVAIVIGWLLFRLCEASANRQINP